MKSLYAFFTLALIISGCASTKSTPNPIIGSWDYTVYSTPNGDTNGTLVISEVKGEYNASFNNVEYGNGDVSKLVIEDGVLKGTVFVADMYLDLDLKFNAESFAGTIGAYDIGVFDIDGKKLVQ